MEHSNPSAPPGDTLPPDWPESESWWHDEPRRQAILALSADIANLLIDRTDDRLSVAERDALTVRIRRVQAQRDALEAEA